MQHAVDTLVMFSKEKVLLLPLMNAIASTAFPSISHPQSLPCKSNLGHIVYAFSLLFSLKSVKKDRNKSHVEVCLYKYCCVGLYCFCLYFVLVIDITLVIV